MNARKSIRCAQYAFTGIGLLILGYCAAIWFGARLYQESNARVFDRQSPSTTPPAARPASPPVAVPRDGRIVGKLQIPRLGVSVVIVEGVGRKELEHAVGHIPGTALPGQRGNVAIAGHRDTFFRPLAGIHPDDTIRMETLREILQYRVTSTETVLPDNLSVLRPAAQDTLTLVTCYPFYYIGAAPKRFIVHAARLRAGSGFPTTSGIAIAARSGTCHGTWRLAVAEWPGSVRKSFSDSLTSLTPLWHAPCILNRGSTKKSGL